MKKEPMYKKPVCRFCKKTFLWEDLIRNVKAGNRQYYSCNPCNTARMKKYRETEMGRKRTTLAVQKSNIKHIKKQKARMAISYLIQIGKITRGICSVCKEKKAEAHHTNYEKPLEIIWLCKKHHAEQHRKEKQQC